MGLGFSKLKSLFSKEINTGTSGSNVLGVDIGSSAIKFVQVNATKDVPTLGTYGELQLGPYEGIDIGRTTHLPPKKIMEALTDILREGGASSKNVVYSISYGSSFTITMPIPTLDKEKIAPMIPVEARKYIPIPLSKVSLDWLPIGVDEENGVTDVLVTAVYNEMEKQYETVMNGAGLSVLANEIEIFSTIRSSVSTGDENVIVLDLGASSTRLYIVEKGVINRTHSVPVSGSGLTNEISKELVLEFDKAEELKREVGLVESQSSPQVPKILVRALEKGVRELHTVVQRYSEQENIKFDKVILSGGGALMSGLVPYISDTFSMKVELANPFSKVAYPAFLEDTLEEAGSSFAVAVGLAIRGFQHIK